MGSNRGGKTGRIGGALPSYVLPSIVYEHAFDESAKLIFDGPFDADERVRAIEWELRRSDDLSRFPVLAKLPDGSTIRYHKTDAATGKPPVVVIFAASANREHLVFHDIFSDSNYDDDDE